MSRSFLHLALSTLTLILALNVAKAQADLLLEPYLGYMSGHWKQNSSTSQGGIDFGARAGWQNLGLQLGVDYMTGSMSDKSTPTSNDVTPNDFGVFVGYSFPIMLRVYGVYDFLSTPKYSHTGTLEGHAVKLGVGFTPLPLVEINFEYYSGSYDKVKSSGATLAPNVDVAMYGINVSVPLTF